MVVMCNLLGERSGKHEDDGRHHGEDELAPKAKPAVAATGNRSPAEVEAGKVGEGIG